MDIDMVNGYWCDNYGYNKYFICSDIHYNFGIPIIKLTFNIHLLMSYTYVVDSCRMPCLPALLVAIM